MTKTLNSYSSLLVVLATALSAAPVGNVSAEEQITEILVTVQKREEALSEVPLSAQAFTGEALESVGARELSDVVNFIPGASMGRSTQAATKTYQIRGVTSYFGESTVGYYLDEAAFSIPNRNYAPVGRTFDVERVEVARGPQGTLYGLGAMGGVIRFITADPDLQEFQLRSDVGVSDTKDGELNYYGDLAVSVPLIEDMLAVRATGSYELQGGYAESPTFPGKESEDELQNYRLKVLATPTEDLTLKLMYQRDESSDDMGKQFATSGPPSHLPSDPPTYLPSRLNGADIPNYNESDYDMFTGYISYDLGPVLIESATGYIDRKDDGQVPLQVSVPFTLESNPILTVDGSSETLSSELRFLSQTEGPLQWIFGGIYQDSENVEGVLLRGNVIAGPPFLLGPRSFRDGTTTYESESYAVFGEVSYELFDGRLIPLVGLRYFTDDRSITDVNRIPPPPTPAPSIYADDETFDSLNPRFNLAYKMTDDDLLYLNIAKGFRSGTFNNQQAINDSTFPNAQAAVDEDSLWSYETGVKLNYLDSDLLVEAAIYYWDWSDQQVNFSTPTNVQYILNAGDSTAVGFDYGFSWVTPLEGLTVRLAGNINSTEFDSIDPEVAPYLDGSIAPLPPTNIVEGYQVANVPKHTESLELSYIQPLAALDAEMSFVSVYSHIARQGDPGLTVKGDSQELLRLRAGLKWDQWGAYLFGNNLLDSEDPIQISGSGFMRNYPRTLGMEVTFEY